MAARGSSLNGRFVVATIGRNEPAKQRACSDTVWCRCQTDRRVAFTSKNTLLCCSFDGLDAEGQAEGAVLEPSTHTIYGPQGILTVASMIHMHFFNQRVTW
ncbi:hypothetical protein BaRGS_00014438 [Batillaria attramentaria]|uniref:Uncharacterized protein n=1 Tax=Batillaria attramentaria TaxID=370345 RepID=A0ABD0L5B0_9CAEN